MSNGLASIVVPILAPLIPALFAFIGVWWKGRRDRRDLDQERHRVLTQVHEEIDVIEAWVKAYRLVVPDAAKPEVWSRAENDLERAYVRLTESLNVSRGVETRATFVEIFKVLLLIRPLQGSPAKVMRILYYVSLAFVAIWVSWMSVAAITQPSGVGYLIVGLTVFLIGNILVSLGLYMLVLRLDRKARPAATYPPSAKIGLASRPPPDRHGSLPSKTTACRKTFRPSMFLVSWSPAPAM